MENINGYDNWKLMSDEDARAAKGRSSRLVTADDDYEELD